MTSSDPVVFQWHGFCGVHVYQCGQGFSGCIPVWAGVLWLYTSVGGGSLAVYQCGRGFSGVHVHVYTSVAGGSLAYMYTSVAGGSLAYMYTSVAGGSQAYMYTSVVGGSLAYMYTSVGGSSLAYMYTSVGGGSVATTGCLEGLGSLGHSVHENAAILCSLCYVQTFYCFCREFYVLIGSVYWKRTTCICH